MEFKVGDTVVWKSQGGGIEKSKMGTIYKIIPAGYAVYKGGHLKNVCGSN